MVFKKSNDKIMHIWEKVLNTAMDVLENTRNMTMRSMISPFLDLEFNHFTENIKNNVIEKKIKVVKKHELQRIENSLIDMEFSVNTAFQYYKLVRCIEGEKKAGVRIMRAINTRLDRKFQVEGN